MMLKLSSFPSLSALLVALAVAFTPLATSAAELSPEQVEKLKTRFKEGMELQAQGKLREALVKFEENIKEAPQSPGSLFFAGTNSLRLDLNQKAADYFEAFLKLEGEEEWQRAQAIEQAIQANQALKKNVKVARLRGQLIALRNEVRDAGKKVPGLTDMRGFRRERITLPDGKLATIIEYFDFREDNLLFSLDQLDDSGTVLQRQILISYYDEKTQELRAKLPNLPANQTEVYLYMEPTFEGGKIVNYKIYETKQGRPEYDAAREWLLQTYSNPPKPEVITEAKQQP